MINLAVISIKDILNFLKKVLFIVLIIFFLIKFYKIVIHINYFAVFDKLNFIKASHTNAIDDTILISNYNNGIKSIKRKSGLRRLLENEFSMFSVEDELMEKENLEELTEFANNTIESEENNDKEDTNLGDYNNVKKEAVQNQTENLINDIPNFVDGKIISLNNKKDTFTNIYNSVKIKNESSYELTSEMLIPNVDFENKKDIIIYHTHTCESYTPTAENSYVASGNFRTIDLNHSVSRVGDELTNYLTGFGYNVIHNKNYHDYPAYTGSYSRSLATINGILQSNSDAEFVIDLHRDALSNSNYGPTVQLGNETVSQIMFVIGTDGGGLEHPNWLYNFKLAIKLQEKANEMYPGLFKPIILRNSRYNQHVTKGACIIEVGATGNTIEQCNGSMKYLANVIKEVMK